MSKSYKTSVLKFRSTQRLKSLPKMRPPVAPIEAMTMAYHSNFSFMNNMAIEETPRPNNSNLCNSILGEYFQKRNLNMDSL